jgi:drug/metabolite transporter (DMT)-like permease
MLVTATCWALATTLDKMALEIAGVSTHGAVLAGGVATGILVITAIRGRLGLLAEGWQHRGWLLIAMFAGTLALALQLYTYQFMYVGIFESIKRTFGLSSAVLVGSLLFGEEVNAEKLFPMLLMIGGVVLVTAF